MSANIYTYAQASGTAKPWWSNGYHQELSPYDTLDTWMSQTKTDGNILRKYVYVKEGEEFIPIENFIAVTPDTYRRSKKGIKVCRAYQMASPDYKIFQNSQIFRMMLSYIDSGDMTLETMGRLGEDGAIVWVLAKINNCSFTIGNNDKSETYLLLATSHDGSLAYIGILTSVRVVCQNTLRAAVGEGQKLFKLKHTKNADLNAVHAQAKRDIEKYRKANEKMHEVAQQLSEIKLDRDTVDTFTYQLTQPTLFNRIIEESQQKLSAANAAKLANGSLLDSIVDGFDLARVLRNESDHNKAGREILSALVGSPGSDMDTARGTAWGYVNAVSYYYDHVAGNDPSARLQSNFFGHYGDQKDRAIELCLDYASKN